jgi:hypothetical protein
MFETTSFTVAQAIAAFLNSGHWLDRALPARLAWWTRELGQDPAGSLSPETIDARPPPAARRPGLCGRAHRQADIGGTFNRYRSSLASVYKWLHKERLPPRSVLSPV